MQATTSSTSAKNCQTRSSGASTANSCVSWIGRPLSSGFARAADANQELAYCQASWSRRFGSWSRRFGRRLEREQQPPQKSGEFGSLLDGERPEQLLLV